MPDLFDSRPVTLREQIACVEREIGFRIRVYGRRVAEQKMTKDDSDREVGAMRAVLETLIGLHARQDAEARIGGML